MGWYKGGGGWGGREGWGKGGGGVGKGGGGGLAQGKGRVGWAGTREGVTREGWEGVGGEGGGCYKAPQGKGWVAWMTAAARGGAAARGCYKGTQGMGGLGIVSIRTLLFRFEPLLTRLSTDNVWLKT